MKNLINKHQVDAIRKAYTQLDKHLTQEEVNLVLKTSPFSVDKRAAEYFGVHITSYRGWVKGRSKPSGRAKMLFNVILNMLEFQQVADNPTEEGIKVIDI